MKARDLASQRALAEADARREAETTLVDMCTTSGIQAGAQGENAQAALWFANAARRANADPDRQRANAIRARTWGPPGFHTAPRPRCRRVVAGGSRLPPRRTPLDHQDGDRRQDQGRQQYALGSGRRAGRLPFPGDFQTVPAAAWSPDGRTLAVGRTDGGVLVTSFPGGAGAARIPFPGRIRRLIFSADGRYLAIAGGESARVWDCTTSAFATPELVHPSAVTTLAFHPEGQHISRPAAAITTPASSPSPARPKKPLWPPVPHAQLASQAIWDPCFCSPPVFVDGGRGLITYGGKRGLTWRAGGDGGGGPDAGLTRVGREDRRDRTQPRRALSCRLRRSAPPHHPTLRGRHGPPHRSGPRTQEHRVRCDL